MSCLPIAPRGPAAPRPSRNGRAAAALAAALLSLAVAGCTDPATELCDLICDCEGCSGPEYDTCVADADRMFEVADAYGCEDPMDAVYECVVDNDECRDDRFSYADRCDGAQDDLDDCLGDSNVSPLVGDPCTEVRACCLAQVDAMDWTGMEEAKEAALAVCDGYADADADACQSVIDNYEPPTGMDPPPECEF